jgi:hypothetical protein
MLKKVLTYTNLDGEQTTDTLYFNLTKRDFLKFVSKYTDFTGVNLNDDNAIADACRQYVDKIVQNKDLNKIIEFLEDLLLSSYGEKSEDGKHFNKSAKVREDFSNSVAYAEIFGDLVTDGDALTKFLENVIDVSQATPAMSTASKPTVIDN